MGNVADTLSPADFIHMAKVCNQMNQNKELQNMYREALFHMDPEQFDHTSFLELFETVQKPHINKLGRVDQSIFSNLSTAILPSLTKVTTSEQFKEVLNIHETL